MSLGNVDLANLTFEQLDEFLSIKEPENVRLDYKAQCPDDIENIMCAFANTLGGLIVIGVDEDRTTNEPIWPPVGKTTYLQDVKKGLIERLQSKANNAVYPPVAVEISKVVENEHVQGKVLIVVKVHQSKLSPHAVNQRREALVYERTNNQGKPYRLADIDQIQAMLKRRNDIEDMRNQFIAFEHESMSHIHGDANAAVRWVAIQPYFPIDYHMTIKQTETYLKNAFLSYKPGNTSRVHDGAYKSFTDYHDGKSVYSGKCKLSTKGQLYLSELSFDNANRSTVPSDHHLASGTQFKYYDLIPLVQMMAHTIIDAGKVYAEIQELRPEFYTVSYGVKGFGVIKFQLKGAANANSNYPYRTLERELSASYSDLTTNRKKFLSDLVEDMYLSLDFDQSYSERMKQEVMSIV